MFGSKAIVPAINRQSVVVASAVGASLILGGGGGATVLVDMGLECLLAVLFGFWIVGRWSPARVGRAPWLLVALTLVLPAVQLVPLPPAVWAHLPGRGLEAVALDLVGQAHSWRPLSVYPRLTLSALLAMAAAVMLVPMVASLDRGGRMLVLLVILGVAVLSLLVGAVQITGGSDNIFRFYDQYGVFIYGFQGNRGREADHLLIAIIAVGAITRYLVDNRSMSGRPSTTLAINGVATLVLAIGVILTGSRIGMATIPVAIALQAWLIWPQVVEWHRELTQDFH